jgi:integrase
MYQFFYLRISGKDKTMGSICEAVFDDRTPIRRVSLKINIPVKLWDKRNQRVKENDQVNYQHINYTINKIKTDFLTANETAPKLNKECFIEFALQVLEKDYDNVETQKKYRTIVNSLHKYVTEELKFKSLPIDELRKIEFIAGYRKWLRQTQYNGNRPQKSKRKRTVFNYLVVLKNLVKRFNQQNPHLEEIKTIHYLAEIGKFEKVQSKMLYPHEIQKVISHVPRGASRLGKTVDAKFHFLFQFFTSGLRVSDLLLLNFKHFANGRIEFTVKKNSDYGSLPFGFKSCKILSHFYPQEYQQAIGQNTLGEYDLTKEELDEFIMINSKKDLESLSIEDLHSLVQFLAKDKKNDNSRRLTIIKDVVRRVEENVAESMCSIMGSKPSGLVFDYLDYEDFKGIKIAGDRVLTATQAYNLHRARCQYNSRLKRLAEEVGISKLTSHVSRHSFAFHMLSSGASVEEISYALVHGSVEMTENYLKQFPNKFSDKAIKRFEDGFEI